MTTAVIEDWAVDTVYTAGQMVFVVDQGAAYTNKLFRCLTGHTALAWATDYGNDLWEERPLKGTQGIQGDAGPKGDTGEAGAAGAAGANGATGADGIFSAIASQAEAQAGTDNAKGMTALRVKNAIDSQVPNLSVITTAQADISAIKTAATLLTSRVNVLEGLSTLVRTRGEQRINNNQAVALSIEGSDNVGEGGKGNSFMLDGDNATSYRIEAEIYREDDAEVRFSTVILRAHFIGGTWYIAREDTTVLLGGDDGVEFTIDNLANNEGQVQYTSDDMAGGNYVSTSYVRYLIEQLAKNF